MKNLPVKDAKVVHLKPVVNFVNLVEMDTFETVMNVFSVRMKVGATIMEVVLKLVTTVCVLETLSENAATLVKQNILD